MSNPLSDELNQLLNDPISYEPMGDAVITPYGHTFSDASLQMWLTRQTSCPVSQQPLRYDMVRPNYLVRDIVKMAKSHEERGNIGIEEDTLKRKIQLELELKVSYAMRDQYEKELQIVSEKIQCSSKDTRHTKAVHDTLDNKENQISIEIRSQKALISKLMAKQPSPPAGELQQEEHKLKQLAEALASTRAEKLETPRVEDLIDTKKELQTQADAFAAQAKDKEKELLTVSQNLDQYTKRMRAFLSEAEGIGSSVDSAFPRALEATKLKGKGNKHFKNKEFEAAAEMYSQAIGKFVDPTFLLNRAAAYTEMGEYLFAQTDLENALQLELSSELHGKCYRRMATVYFKQQLIVEAIQWTNKALALNPDDRLAKNLLQALQSRH